jgi:ABC-type protease/lipase transport system fused ATPase/permease subunit
MTEKHDTTCSWNRPLSLAARVALCIGLGASLAVSNDLATGVAVAGGLFLALTPVVKHD